MIIATRIRTGVVISYAHADKRYKYVERLEKHLAPFVKNQKVDYWIDTRIKPGSDWRKEIKQVFESAKVAILLVSADYLASEFIVENELPPLVAAAQQEEAVILIVILSPCAFKHTELEPYQTINSPSQPLSSMGRNNREMIWVTVAEQVSGALNC